MSNSMTFKAWKISISNSMIFHDFPGSVGTLDHTQRFRDLGGSVVRPLAAGTKGSGLNSPIAQHVQRFIFSGLYVWRDLFIGIELDLGPTTSVHFLLNFFVSLNLIV